MAVALVAGLLPLQQLAVESVEERIGRSDPKTCMDRFLNYPPNPAIANAYLPSSIVPHPFTPNPEFWLKDVDFSCVSPWNSGGGRLRAGTAISKRHIVFAKHFPLWKGVRIVFVGDDGGVCPCNIEAVKDIKDSDIMIGSLNAELTPNIHPAKILPDNYKKYLDYGVELPIVTFNQHEQASLMECGCISTNRFRKMGCYNTKRETWKPFWRKLVVGDSGNPAFLLIGKDPILVYCVTHGGGGAGFAVHRYRREIQAAMDELCPGYKLEEFDFSQVKMKSEKLRDDKL